MDAKLELTPHGVFANPMQSSMAEAISEINKRLVGLQRLNYHRSV